MSPYAADAWLAAMGRASWQGGLALALAWAVCRAFPKLPPAARCWVWRLAYLKVLVALLGPAPLELPLLRAPEPVAQVAVAASVRPTQTTPVTDAPDDPDVISSAIAAEVTSPTPLPATPFDRRPTSAGKPPPVDRRSPATSLFAAWSLGVAFVALRLAAGFRMTVRLRRRARALDDAIVVDVYATLARQYRITRPPPLLGVADLPGGPLLLGMFRPVIVLPASWLASPTDRPSADQLRLMLAHELAHVRRRDLWWNALAAVCHGLLFFHPLAWLAAREYALARESACDAAALAATGARPADYGQMLLGVVARVRRQPCRILPTLSPVAAAGVAGSAATLHRRLTAMQSICPWPRRRLALAAAVLSLIGTVGLVPWRVVAQQRRESPQQQEQQSRPDAPAAPGEKAADPAPPGMDVPAGHIVKIFRLNHVQADKVAEIVPSLAAKTGDPVLKREFTVAFDERTNSLIVSGPAATVRSVGKLVEEMDRAAVSGGGGDPAPAAKAPANPAEKQPDDDQSRRFPVPGENPYRPGSGRAGGGLPYAPLPFGAAGGEREPQQMVLVGRLVSATAEIRAPVDGIVDEVRFKEGDRVTKGQALATLNHRKLAAALAAAEARYKAVDVVLQRQQDLVKKNLTSNSEFEQAKAAADEARAGIVLAKQAIEDAMVLAPFAGVVSSARAQAGEVVSRGARLGTVVEVDALKVEFEVPESLLAQLQVGQEVKFQHQASSETLSARISFISPEVDPRTDTVRVKAEVDNSRGRLRTGGTVQVLIPAPPAGEGAGRPDAPVRVPQP